MDKQALRDKIMDLQLKLDPIRKDLIRTNNLIKSLEKQSEDLAEQKRKIQQEIVKLTWTLEDMEEDPEHDS